VRRQSYDGWPLSQGKIDCPMLVMIQIDYPEKILLGISMKVSAIKSYTQRNCWLFAAINQNISQKYFLQAIFRNNY